jgi:hypothetical protein
MGRFSTTPNPQLRTDTGRTFHTVLDANGALHALADAQEAFQSTTHATITLSRHIGASLARPKTSGWPGRGNQRGDASSRVLSAS